VKYLVQWHWTDAQVRLKEGPASVLAPTADAALRAVRAAFPEAFPETDSPAWGPFLPVPVWESREARRDPREPSVALVIPLPDDRAAALGHLGTVGE
jgi:hypothetical protein